MITSESLHSQVLEVSLNGVYIYDVKLRQNVFINDQYTKITGYSLENLKTMNGARFMDLFHRNDRRRVNEHFEKIAGGSEDMAEIEYRFKTKDGRWIWCLSRDKIFARDPDGAVSRIIGTFLDVTERKKAQEAMRKSQERESRQRGLLRILLENMQSCIAAMEGQELRYTVASRAYRALRPETEMIGRAYREVFPDAADTETESLLRKVLATGEAIQAEIRIVVSGKIRFYDTSLIPWRDNRGKIIGVVIVHGRDIEDRKNAETALPRRNENPEKPTAEPAEARTRQLQLLAVELVKAEERERQRVSELLHEDLQQLLVAARFQVETACERHPRDPLLKNVQRLLKKSIGKSRTLSHELSPPMLRHSGIVDALAWLARRLDEQFGLKVELKTAIQKRFETASLKMFMFRAVQELLFNVVKHAGVKSARVELSESDNDIVITVSDPGRGFNSDILEDFATTTGLGLLSIRERTRYLGGDLTIESVHGQGSRFTLTLPINLAKSGDPERSGSTSERMRSLPVELADSEISEE